MSKMRTYVVEMIKFRFPVGLDKDKVDFRLQVDIRHMDENGNFNIHTVFLPGLDLYWECSEEKNRNPEKDSKPDGQLVRKEDGQGGYEPEVDFEKVGTWGKRFRFHTVQLYELRVFVFHVEQKNWLDDVTDALGGAIKKAAEIAAKMTGPLELFTNEAFATIGRKINDNDDKILVVHSGGFKKNRVGAGGSWSFKSHAGYEFEFTAKIESDPSS